MKSRPVARRDGVDRWQHLRASATDAPLGAREPGDRHPRALRVGIGLHTTDAQHDHSGHRRGPRWDAMRVACQEIDAGRQVATETLVAACVTTLITRRSRASTSHRAGANERRCPSASCNAACNARLHATPMRERNLMCTPCEYADRAVVWGDFGKRIGPRVIQAALTAGTASAIAGVETRLSSHRPGCLDDRKNRPGPLP